MLLSPNAMALLRQVRSRPSEGGQPINITIDLSAIKDLWGRKQNEEEDESLEAKSSPVHITNMPRISPG